MRSLTIEAGGNFEDITPNVEKKAAGLPVVALDAFGFRIFRRK
ncbi:MAG TPA: hypothetical protein VK400_05120 [Pyrinomonadaceae bacterium]|nr:hypothetical protein [Pyrinomonadaceae bacterium]